MKHGKQQQIFPLGLFWSGISSLWRLCSHDVDPDLWQKAFTHRVQSENFFKPLCLIVCIHTVIIAPYTMRCSHSAHYTIHEPETHWISGSWRQWKTWLTFQQFFIKAKGNATYYRAEAVLEHTQQQAINEPTKEMNVSIFQTTVVFCIQFTWGWTELQLQDFRTFKRAPKSAHLDHLTEWRQWEPSGTDFNSNTGRVCLSTVESQGRHKPHKAAERGELCHFLLNNLN